MAKCISIPQRQRSGLPEKRLPDTTYTLRLAPGLTDIFGQTLDTVQEWVFHVQAKPQPLGKLHFPAADGIDSTLRTKAEYSLFTQNLEELRVLIYQVEPGGLATLRICESPGSGGAWAHSVVLLI